MRRRFIACGDGGLSTFLVKRTIIGIARRYKQELEQVSTRDFIFMAIGDSYKDRNALVVFYGDKARDTFYEVQSGENFMQDWTERNKAVCVFITDGKARDNKFEQNGATYITCSRKHLETRLTCPVGYKEKRKFRY